MMLTILFTTLWTKDTPLYIIVAGIVGYVAYRIIVKKVATQSTGKPKRKGGKPTEEVTNDYLVVVGNIDGERIKTVIKESCDLYNEDKFQLLVKLEVGDTTHVLTFPWGIEYANFCTFVNYLVYPQYANTDSTYKPTVMGWGSPSINEEFVTDEIALQTLMLYIPETDTEYDAVYITTEDGEGYIVDFSFSRVKPIKEGFIPYQPYPTEAYNFVGKETIYFN